MSDKKSSGLRTQVKMGEISPQEAAKHLLQQRAMGHFVKPEVLAWLKRRM